MSDATVYDALAAAQVARTRHGQRVIRVARHVFAAKCPPLPHHARSSRCTAGLIPFTLITVTMSCIAAHEGRILPGASERSEGAAAVATD